MSDTPDEKPVWRDATYTLKFPITIEGQEPITTIRLQEPDIEALEAMEDAGALAGGKVTVKQSVAIIAAIARLPIATIRKAHRDDFAALSEIAAPLAFGTTAADQ